MASTLVVPPSKHTLFMRGFSSHQGVDRIRDFFKRESGGGDCTVEFFKESDTRDKLFIALRFESRDVAKDILNRYDSTDIMGDRVTISWFKDLRRARQKGLIPPYNNNYKNNFADSGGKPFYYNNNYGKPGFFRAAEEERRRATARGVSPLRNGFRPGQFKSYRDGEKEQPGPGSNPQGRRSRQDSWRRSTGTPGGRRRTDSSMSRSNSRSRSRSYSNSRSHSTHSRTPSRDRSQSPHQSRSSHKTHSPDARDSRSGDNQDGGGRDEKGHWSPDRYSANERVSERRNHERSPAGSGAKWSRDSRSRDRSPNSHQDRSPSGRGQDGDWDRLPERSKYIRSTVVKSIPERKSGGDFEERFSPEPPPRYHLRTDTRSDLSPLPDRTNDYDRINSYQKDKKESPGSSRGPSWRSTEPRQRSPTHSSPPAPPAAQEYNREYDNRNSRQRDRLSPENEVEISNKRRSDDRYQGDDLEGKRRRYQDESSTGPSQSPTRPLKADKERTWSGSRPRADRSPDTEAERRKMSSQTTPSIGINGNGDLGALGLPQEKMMLVREKKEEIERAYRQDCETFASVVKMLISKDPELEGSLQSSLRENLKEIGQRCIHELREFIEKLKSQRAGSK